MSRATDGPQCLDVPSLATARGYSHGVIAPAGSRMLFVAGQIAWNRDEEVVGEDFATQFGQALANVLEVVKVAGGRAEHITQLTIYVIDKNAYIAQLSEIGVVYREHMGRHYPAMALVEVRALLEPRAHVEIQAVAALPAA
ncbi:MAG: RidA family protein [Acidobacteriota bacterium]